MTKEQIAALIAAKIAGQGSMVDIGGALPEILTALAENGISTDMTVAEQMQARKNLGLYYEETITGEKEIAANGDVESKLSDDTPAKEDILKVFNGDNELDFTLVDIEGGYLVNAQTISVFRVMEGDGIYTGSMWATSVYKLIYNGQTTVVSKVPDKYLPIAWNQLVTEGTKIAEVTIGEETTEVFAPEGGGGLEYVSIAQQLFEDTGVDLTQAFGISSQNYADLCQGKKAGLSVFTVGYNYFSFISGNYFTTPGFEASNVTLLNGRDIWTITGAVNSATITKMQIATGTVPGPVTLSGLPTASMTTQEELDAIGLTANNMQAAIDGKKTVINYTDMAGTKYMGVFVSGLSLDSALLKTIVFTLDGNKYSVRNQAGTVTVTVTPL